MGIGRSVAFRFAAENSQIVILHNDPDEAASQETLASVTRKGVTAESQKVDVSSWEQVNACFKQIFNKYEKIDILVNNAGITRDSLLPRMSEENWDMVIGVNLKGVFNCTQAVIRSMMKQRSGRIVNIASVVGQIGNIGQANYAASKAGIMGLTKTVARELASRGITVNAVAPGFIDTEMTAALPEKVKQAFIQQIPLGRMGKPEEVAELVFWLCSDGAGYMTGQVIHLNGGMYM